MQRFRRIKILSLNLGIKSHIMKRFIYIILGCLLCLTACRKDQFNNTTTDTEYPPLTTSKLKRIYGTVVDENGNRLEGIKIVCRNKVHLSGKDGSFDFEEYISTEREILKIQGTNFYTSFIYIQSSGEGDFILMPQLSQKYLGHTINTNQRKLVTIQKECNLSFYNDDFIKQDGSTYQGSINFDFQVKPGTELKYYQMPNDRLALYNDKKVVLADLPIVSTEAIGDNKTKLEFRKPAKLEIPITIKKYNFGTDSIFLWKFRESDGIWEKISTVEIQTDKVIALLPTFGIYTVSPPLDYSTVSGQFQGISKFEFLQYEFTSTQSTIQNFLTDAGSFDIKVPINIPYKAILRNELNQNLYQVNETIYNRNISQRNINLIQEKCVSMDFTVSICSFVLNEISHSLIIREKGKIADLFFQFENQNTFLKTFKQSETDQFSIFLMSQNKQTILRNTPKILKNADLLSKNIIEVCNNNSGQAHMKLKNSKTGTTTYHYLPFTSIQADTISNSTVELNIVLRDPYNTSDEGIYSATINIINGSIIHMNPIIQKAKLGSPDFDFDFTFKPSTTANISRSSTITNQIYININNLDIRDNLNNEYNGSISGYFFTN